MIDATIMPAGMDGIQWNALRRFNVADALHRSALRYPKRTALMFEEETISYETLEQWANQVARWLLSQGMRAGDVVAALSLNHPKLVALWMGSARIGAVYCPINPLLPPQDVTEILQRMHAQILFVDDAMMPTAQQIVVEGLPRISLESAQSQFSPWNETVGQADTAYVQALVPSEAVATLLFTSGTESQPKGVMNTHANWYAALLSMLADLEMNHQQKVLLALPLFHVAGLYVLFGTLATGAEGYLLRRIVPQNILYDIDHCQLTWMCLPATVYISLMSVPEFKDASLASLKKGIVFQYLPTTPLNQWKARLPHVQWSTYWGQSELTPLGASMPSEEFWNRSNDPDPIGLPHLPVEMRLVDATDRDVPQGAPGEIIVRSPSVMAGYFEDAARTLEVFRGGWHHTGDVAFQDSDGFYHFIDRKKDIIKCGGENVSSQKVEEAIASVPGVAEVAVIGVPDPYWIEAVVAIVVPTGSAVVAEHTLRTVCRSRLAAYEVPKSFVLVKSLPKNAAGKILKRELIRQMISEDSENH